MAADLLPPFLGDFLQHLRIVPAAPAAPSVAATHLFMQTASAAMLSSEGLVLEDVPPFTQYTAFSKDGEHIPVATDWPQQGPAIADMPNSA